MEPPINAPGRWSYLSHHGQLLRFLAREPQASLREISAHLELSERAIGSLLGDLERSGVLTRTRQGRRNRYRVHPLAELPHPRESHWQVRRMLSLGSKPVDELDDERERA